MPTISDTHDTGLQTRPAALAGSASLPLIILALWIVNVGVFIYSFAQLGLP